MSNMIKGICLLSPVEAVESLWATSTVALLGTGCFNKARENVGDLTSMFVNRKQRIGILKSGHIKQQAFDIAHHLSDTDHWAYRSEMNTVSMPSV